MGVQKSVSGSTFVTGSYVKCDKNVNLSYFLKTRLVFLKQLIDNNGLKGNFHGLVTLKMLHHNFLHVSVNACELLCLGQSQGMDFNLPLTLKNGIQLRDIMFYPM